jgi:hypothetical protein
MKMLLVRETKPRIAIPIGSTNMLYSPFKRFFSFLVVLLYPRWGSLSPLECCFLPLPRRIIGINVKDHGKLPPGVAKGFKDSLLEKDYCHTPGAGMDGDRGCVALVL